MGYNIHLHFYISSQEGHMGISEKYQCYVYGQCQVSFQLVSRNGSVESLFFKSRNILSISGGKLLTQRLATKLVEKMMTASGGHGSQHIQCACSFPTAQNLGFQTQDSVQNASVGRDCKQNVSIFNIRSQMSFPSQLPSKRMPWHL